MINTGNFWNQCGVGETENWSFSPSVLPPFYRKPSQNLENILAPGHGSPIPGPSPGPVTPRGLQLSGCPESKKGAPGGKLGVVGGGEVGWGGGCGGSSGGGPWADARPQRPEADLCMDCGSYASAQAAESRWCMCGKANRRNSRHCGDQRSSGHCQRMHRIRRARAGPLD